MNIEIILAGLIDGFEGDYSPEELAFMAKRLEEIAKENNLSLDELDYYCTANSSEMFACIFDYKEFNKKNFDVD